MNKLIIIIIAILILIAVGIGSYFVFHKFISFNSGKDKENITKEKSKITQTCDELCKLKNYSSGICRSKALHPDVNACEKDEINEGQSSDCKVSSNKDEPIGIRKTCCC